MNELFDFSTFPTLETERLRLREIVATDAEAIFRIRGDYEVTKYNIGAAYERIEQVSELIVATQEAFQNEAEIRWGITLKGGDGELVGVCGFNYWSRRDCRASVGYDMARAYWGRGIMSEGLGAVVAFGFARMGLNRIEADADVRNPASQRVLEKLGFQQEGIQREQFWDNGMFYDLALFSLLRRDYEGRK